MSAGNVEVRYEIDAHVATVTLDAPERMNTISPQMLFEITEIAEGVAAFVEKRDPNVTGR